MKVDTVLFGVGWLPVHFHFWTSVFLFAYCTVKGGQRIVLHLYKSEFDVVVHIIDVGSKHPNTFFLIKAQVSSTNQYQRLGDVARKVFKSIFYCSPIYGLANIGDTSKLMARPYCSL